MPYAFDVSAKSSWVITKDRMHTLGPSSLQTVYEIVVVVVVMDGDVLFFLVVVVVVVVPESDSDGVILFVVVVVIPEPDPADLPVVVVIVVVVDVPVVVLSIVVVEPGEDVLVEVILAGPRKNDVMCCPCCSVQPTTVVLSSGLRVQPKAETPMPLDRTHLKITSVLNSY